MEKSYSQKKSIKILTNPFYCLKKVNDNFCIEHETMIDEDTFINTGIKLINEIGAKEYLENLLDNLKGNYII